MRPTATAGGGTRTAWLYVVLFLSGAAGLGYEIAWTRQFAVGLGHEVPSMLAVVAAFFGGLAVGAWAFDGPISRSARPGRWYVGLELAMALWALATIALIPWGNEQVARLTGALPSAARHWAVAFAVPFVLLLPATAAMGATLPAMDRLVARVRGSGRNVGGLYAVNTLGAVAGTLGAAFVLVPRLGLTSTVLALAGVNALAALGVALLLRSGADERPDVVEPAGEVAGARLLGTLFVTGLFGIGYEVLGVRVIGQVLENTVYSFACALGVYLVGTTLGAALHQRLARAAGFEPLLARLLHATSAACLLGVLVMAQARPIYAALAATPGFGRAVAAELGLAAAVFLVPALLMGATFAHLAQAARRAEGGVGAALAVNTLGAALAPLTFGVLLLPAIGARWALVAVALGYASLRPGRGRWVPWGTALALLAVLVLPSDLRLVRPPAGGRLLEHREGVMAGVAVVADQAGRRYLKVNDRFHMGGSGGGFAARRSGHLPLLFHPNPRRALFLGLGGGTTFHTAGWHPGLRARCVELLPEVVELREHFLTAEDRFDPARESIVAADARRYVRATDERYDVIVADLFHPARDGSGSLYTREHFESIRARLAEGGLFCQWLPLYQLEPQTLRVIVRTFLASFEDVHAYLSDFNVRHPVLGLVGRSAPTRLGPRWYGDRARDDELRGALERVALRNGLQVLGGYVGDRADLAALAGEGPQNFDDRPVVTYLAPRLAYARTDPSESNLRAVLALEPEAADVVDTAALGAADFARRLELYWDARDLFLAGELADTPEERLAALLSSVEASTDFATSYHVLLQDVANEGASRPQLARAVLERLIRAHPHRAEAGALRAELFGE
jgi:spermidine synthase